MTHSASTVLSRPLPNVKRSPPRVANPRKPLSRPTLNTNATIRDEQAALGIDLDRFFRGDPGAFRTVLRQFGPLIMSIAASYTPNHHDREELYQEISVRLWERRARYSGRGPLGGWINRIAHNYCKDWRGSQTSREAAAERHVSEKIALGEAGTVLDDPSMLLERKEFMVRLRDALAQLPPRQERTFILVHVEGRSVSETARILRVRRATVRSNLRHASSKLRNVMEDFRE